MKPTGSGEEKGKKPMKEGDEEEKKKERRREIELGKMPMKQADEEERRKDNMKIELGKMPMKKADEKDRRKDRMKIDLGKTPLLAKDEEAKKKARMREIKLGKFPMVGGDKKKKKKKVVVPILRRETRLGGRPSLSKEDVKKKVAMATTKKTAQEKHVTFNPIVQERLIPPRDPPGGTADGSGGDGGKGGDGASSSNPPKSKKPKIVTRSRDPLPDVIVELLRPTPVIEETVIIRPFWKYMFYGHLIAFLALAAYLTLRGFYAPHRTFNLSNLYGPLSISISVSALSTLMFLLFVIEFPRLFIRSALVCGPISTCVLGLLLIPAWTNIAFALSALTIFLSLNLGVYTCWSGQRLRHATNVLIFSIIALRVGVSGTTKYMVLAVLAAIAYSIVWVLAVGGVVASGTHFVTTYISLLVISLFWTMQVIRNVVHVAISRAVYNHIRDNTVNVNASESFKLAATEVLQSVCYGSIIVPLIGVLRGFGRFLSLGSTGNIDSFYSCGDCYMLVADQLMVYGNRWAFVHVGVHQKRFITASGDVWRAFENARLVPLVDADITSSVCFFAGVDGGVFAALAGAVIGYLFEKERIPEIAVCAFLIGYYMVRITMALPQACVSAYHVMFADNPRNPRINPCLANRKRQLLPH